MKPLASRLALAIAAFAAISYSAAAADATPPAAAKSVPQQSPGRHERFDTKILKVFSAKDGDAIFRAYLVKWKDQEVIASDLLANTDYQVGDEVTVLAMDHAYPKGKEAHRLLGFSILPRDASPPSLMEPSPLTIPGSAEPKDAGTYHP